MERESEILVKMKEAIEVIEAKQVECEMKVEVMGERVKEIG